MRRPEGIIRAKDVNNTVMVVWYAAQEIGCPIPVGHKRRGVLYNQIKEEMEAQRWTWRHLTAAIDYMKSRGIRPRSFVFVFYHVESAIHEGFMPRSATSSLDGLDDAVARAAYMETDDDWTRRLLSARGTAKLKLYQLWERERLPRLEDT